MSTFEPTELTRLKRRGQRVIVDGLPRWLFDSFKPFERGKTASRPSHEGDHFQKSAATA